MRDAPARAALIWALLPLAVHCAAQLRPVGDACDRPTEPAAVRACEHGAGSLDGAARLLFGAGLDPNRTSEQDWTLIPGIGPARARAIVEERESGPYGSVEDLARVHGIGPKTVESLRPWLQPALEVADP